MGGVVAELDWEPVEVDEGGVSVNVKGLVRVRSLAAEFCLPRVLLGIADRTPGCTKSMDLLQLDGEIRRQEMW